MESSLTEFERRLTDAMIAAYRKTTKAAPRVDAVAIEEGTAVRFDQGDDSRKDSAGMTQAEMIRAMRNAWREPRHDQGEHADAGELDPDERPVSPAEGQRRLAEELRNAWRR